MKNTTLLVVAAVVLAIVGGYFAVSSSGNSVSASSRGEQVVRMHVENGQYVLEPSVLKNNVPVRIVADMASMPGCSKSVVISAFGIRKSLSSGDNVIEFTPNKIGTFNIACSMNMYRGGFTVE